MYWYSTYNPEHGEAVTRWQSVSVCVSAGLYTATRHPWSQGLSRRCWKACFRYKCTWVQHVHRMCPGEYCLCTAFQKWESLRVGDVQSTLSSQLWRNNSKFINIKLTTVNTFISTHILYNSSGRIIHSQIINGSPARMGGPLKIPSNVFFNNVLMVLNSCCINMKCYFHFSARFLWACFYLLLLCKFIVGPILHCLKFFDENIK